MLILLDLNDMTLKKNKRYSSYLEMSVSISTVDMPSPERQVARRLAHNRNSDASI